MSSCCAGFCVHLTLYVVSFMIVCLIEHTIHTQGDAWRCRSFREPHESPSHGPSPLCIILAPPHSLTIYPSDGGTHRTRIPYTKPSPSPHPTVHGRREPRAILGGAPHHPYF